MLYVAFFGSLAGTLAQFCRVDDKNCFEIADLRCVFPFLSVSTRGSKATAPGVPKSVHTHGSLTGCNGCSWLIATIAGVQ